MDLQRTIFKVYGQKNTVSKLMDLYDTSTKVNGPPMHFTHLKKYWIERWCTQGRSQKKNLEGGGWTKVLQRLSSTMTTHNRQIYNSLK